MEQKKKNITIGIIIGVVAVLFVVFGTLACLGVFRGFHAEVYVSAVLNHTFKGNVEVAVEMLDGTTEETLYAQYESGIQSFVKNTLLNDAEIDSELEGKYFELCKKIFAKLDYDVQEAEKISDDEFYVPVKYRPTNIMHLYIDALMNETERAKEKKDKGEYRGNYDEIFAKMELDIVANGYIALEGLYDNMEFGEEQTIVFKVVKGEDDLYKLEEAAITEFLIKILSLDAKED